MNWYQTELTRYMAEGKTLEKAAWHLLGEGAYDANALGVAMAMYNLGKLHASRCVVCEGKRWTDDGVGFNNN